MVETESRGVSSGFAAYLTKPLQIDALPTANADVPNEKAG